MTSDARQNIRLSGLVAAGACTAVMLWSATLFATEYRLARDLSGTTGAQIAALAEGERAFPQPRSARSARDLLALCGRVLTIAPGPKADPALAERTARTCGRLAATMLERGPSNGRALAVQLLSSGDNDPQTYNMARLAAPHEPWALNLRLHALSRAAAVGGRAPAGAEADLEHALLSDWGRTAIARLYRDTPHLRPAIARAAGRAPAAAQAAFLRRLTQASGG